MDWGAWLAAVRAFFNQDFFQKVLATAIGVALGAWVALRRERRDRTEREKAKLERRRQLRDALHHSVEMNRAIAASIHTGLENPRSIQFSRTDVTLLDSTAALKYELLKLETCVALDRLRFRLTELNGYIEHGLAIYRDFSLRAKPIVDPTEAPPKSAYELYRETLRSILTTELSQVQARCDEVLGLLETEG